MKRIVADAMIEPIAIPATTGRPGGRPGTVLFKIERLPGLAMHHYGLPSIRSTEEEFFTIGYPSSIR